MWLADAIEFDSFEVRDARSLFEVTKYTSNVAILVKRFTVGGGYYYAYVELPIVDGKVTFSTRPSKPIRNSLARVGIQHHGIRLLSH